MQAELKIIGKPFKYEDFEDEMNVYQNSNPNEVSKIGDLIYVLFTNENRIYTINYDENIEYIGNYTADNEELSNVFYIYHTSDNTVERVSLDDSRVSYDETNNKYIFNIMNEVKKDYLYGGYTSSYGGTTISEEEIKELKYYKTTATTALQYSDTANIGGNWSKDKIGTAYTGIEGGFNYEDFYDTNGTEMNPENGKIYYLKEVSSAYLVPYVHTQFYKSNGKLSALHIISAIDDGCYSEAGTLIKSDSEENASSFSADRVSTFIKFTSYYLSPESIYDKMADKYGYDKNHKMKDKSNGGTNLLFRKNIADTEYFVENITFTLQPYWVTKDSIKITGKSWRLVIEDMKIKQTFFN